MKIDFEEIKVLINNGNLADIVHKTEIPRRTLENYRYEANDSFKNMEETLTTLQKYINEERNKMNIEDIENVDYIWDFEELGDYLDDNNNFKDTEEFYWWKELADSIAFLGEETDTKELDVNELQDYIDIAEEHGYE